MSMCIILIGDGRDRREKKSSNIPKFSEVMAIGYTLSVLTRNTYDTSVIRLNAAICSCSLLRMCLSYVFQYAVMPCRRRCSTHYAWFTHFTVDEWAWNVLMAILVHMYLIFSGVLNVGP